jgi:hypothetical protein
MYLLTPVNHEADEACEANPSCVSFVLFVTFVVTNRFNIKSRGVNL